MAIVPRQSTIVTVTDAKTGATLLRYNFLDGDRAQQWATIAKARLADKGVTALAHYLALDFDGEEGGTVQLGIDGRVAHA